MNICRSYEIVDALLEEYGTQVVIDLDVRGDFDYSVADRWCRLHVGEPGHDIKLTIENGRTGWRLVPRKDGAGWCTHLNHYFFARPSDAIMFKLSL